MSPLMLFQQGETVVMTFQCSGPPKMDVLHVSVYFLHRQILASTEHTRCKVILSKHLTFHVISWTASVKALVNLIIYPHIPVCERKPNGHKDFCPMVFIHEPHLQHMHFKTDAQYHL